jgi:hypothetical protein
MVHEGLWKQLEKLDRIKTAKRAKCQYFKYPERFIIKLLNTDFVVNLFEKEIYSCQPDLQKKPAGFLEELCLLAYLINSRDLPLANKVVREQTLPGGQFFFRGLHSLPTEKLEKAFGGNPELLHQVSRQFGAMRCEFGDASVELYMLPRVPITIVIWGGCEEFNPRASILFDQTAASQLPLDALLAAVNLTVEALIKINSVNT